SGRTAPRAIPADPHQHLPRPLPCSLRQAESLRQPAQSLLRIAHPIKTNSFDNPAVVSPEKWLAARRELLREEKELTRARERLAARRRDLPWVKVNRAYTFDSPSGRVSLADMFEGRSQLIVYHFMLAPGAEAGCR